MARYGTPIPELALGFMNDDHRDELALLEAVAAALAVPAPDRAAVATRLEALAAHTAAHFGREEVVMREVGFPAYAVHKGEHDRVLAELGEHARAYLDAGDAPALLAYVDEVVAGWFPAHIATMDTVTAQFAASRGRR